ncbi:MAG: methyltransferase domain-containing protein [Candidatus Altiarchaeota archaeon]|nr:methyltransferase domain-containing protein [Candidatus Altiarchaeota archaeon]
MKDRRYVHGFSRQEAGRLRDQAGTLSGMIHSDTVYPPGSKVLEAGCGTGAQTVYLARNNPSSMITSVDVSEGFLEKARERIKHEGIKKVSFARADITDLPYAEVFDHAFVCFVLEHIEDPLQALESVKRALKSGGTLTVIEGDHGSAYYHPKSEHAQKTIQCLIDVQASLEGNSLVGRELYPLLKKADYSDIQVKPLTIYADATRPELVEGFTKKTFIAMVEGVREQAIEMKLITKEEWDKGMADLQKTAGVDGTFTYTFHKARGRKS